MKVTFIHPCIGRRAGQPYLRSWQMAPLTPAHLAGLTPADVVIRFYDDSMEPIPFDEPTDLVAMTVEAYTAKRSYQIASEYRKRGVPVVMGGIHATLCPEDVSQYAEAVVIGQAEGLWEDVLQDAERRCLQTYYRAGGSPNLAGFRPNRSIFGSKNYLPISMVERGRGCQFQCDFCSVQSAYGHSYHSRPVEDIVDELKSLKRKPVVFFVDDNITGNIAQAKEFLRAIVPLKIKWVSQGSLNAAYDDEFLDLLAASGCQGLLIGFESLNADNLRRMNKAVNTLRPDFGEALANLARHKIRVYATFVFGYDEDTEESFGQTLRFAMKHRFFMAAFNHLVPFPGTPLYRRLEAEGRLLYERWWMDERYSFNRVPFHPMHMNPEELERGCYESRKAFYGLRSILRRGLNPGNRDSVQMWFYFNMINQMSRREVYQRHHYPLGDETWRGELIKVRSVGVSPLGHSAV